MSYRVHSFLHHLKYFKYPKSFSRTCSISSIPLVESNIQNELKILCKDAIIRSFGSDYQHIESLVTPISKIQYGDYQCNNAMSLSKQLKLNPIDIANQIVQNIPSNKIISKITIEKPGFINMRF